jgi:hypothetical protein
MSDTAKFAAGRLTDLPPPRFADTEVTLNELRQRIDVTADYLKTLYVIGAVLLRPVSCLDHDQCRGRGPPHPGAFTLRASYQQSVQFYADIDWLISQWPNLIIACGGARHKAI